MCPGATRLADVSLVRLTGFGLALTVVPGVAAAQPVDPGTIADAPSYVRGIGSFVLVGAAGATILAGRGPLVDRAVDAVVDRPSVAVLYGSFAFVLVLFLSFYASMLLGEVGAATSPLAYLALAMLVGGVSALGGLGYVVVGTLLTDFYDVRRPWHGLVVGAALSSLGWFLLPVAQALAAWVLVAAFGVGGLTRTWIHSERDPTPY